MKDSKYDVNLFCQTPMNNLLNWKRPVIYKMDFIVQGHKLYPRRTSDCVLIRRRNALLLECWWKKASFFFFCEQARGADQVKKAINLASIGLHTVKCLCVHRAPAPLEPLLYCYSLACAAPLCSSKARGVRDFGYPSRPLDWLDRLNDFGLIQ